MFDELKEKFDAEDFTGHIGFLLDNIIYDHLLYDIDLDESEGTYEFLQELYNIAVKYVT